MAVPTVASPGWVLGAILSLVFANSGSVAGVIAPAVPDRAPESRQHSVVVGNNFFSPENIVVEVGDSVRWSNGFGTHNVFSCNSQQSGCEGETATETFTSGPGAAGPWTFTHVFTEPGPNRYLCQPHFSFMWGSVTVVNSPPAIPDGRAGPPMTIDRMSANSSTLTLNWGSNICSQDADHLVIYGPGSSLPRSLAGVYAATGSACLVGTDAPYDWEKPPLPTQGEFVWWLLLATDGAIVEGSWGSNSAGERNGPGPNGASLACGIRTKDTANTCGQ